MKTRKTLDAILAKAAKAGCTIEGCLPQGPVSSMRGSHYISIRRDETEDCEEINVTVRFSDHRRQLSAKLNHHAPTIETTTKDVGYVCDRLEEELSFLWN